ncbi:hypothetical protein [Streptomyces sp. NPDC059819]|uniref:hypothetical protein n=1 Tax=Streptomyces sp. NPDC059819 TaxID=3346963 RepID=UPI003669AF2C
MNETCTGGPHGGRCDHLQEEDLPAFEEVLQQALECAEIQQALRATGGAMTAVELRALCWQARESIAAPAGPEYHRLLRLRGSNVPVDTSDQLPAVVAVLVPALAGIAAVVFLFVGYGLHLAGSQAQLAGEFQAMGWICALVAGLGVLADVTWLLITAIRNRPATDTVTVPLAEPNTQDTPEVRKQEELWRRTLLVRGVMPFLLARVEQPRNTETTTR